MTSRTSDISPSLRIVTFEEQIHESIKELKQQMIDCRWNLNALNNSCSLFEAQIKQLQKEIICHHLFKRTTPTSKKGTCIQCGQIRENL